MYVCETDFGNMKKTETSKPKKVRQVIHWKNPDIHVSLRRWGEFQGYFEADTIIDPKTGEGTIKLRKP